MLLAAHAPAPKCRVGPTMLLRKLLRDETGATAIEYGLIAALIAVAAVNVMATVGQHLSTTFNTVATKL
jgi:pilus assembly protein Flp/PilA